MIQRLETGRMQLKEHLSPAYHRAGGGTLELCLRTAQYRSLCQKVPT